MAPERIHNIQKSHKIWMLVSFILFTLLYSYIFIFKFNTIHIFLFTQNWRLKICLKSCRLIASTDTYLFFHSNSNLFIHQQISYFNLMYISIDSIYMYFVQSDFMVAISQRFEEYMSKKNKDISCDNIWAWKEKNGLHIFFILISFPSITVLWKLILFLAT